MYKFTKKISCGENMRDCVNNMMTKLETKFNVKLHTDTKTSKVNGHISVSHEKNNHTIWVFLYSNTGIHEGENTITKKIVKTNSNRVEKFNGTFPTESEIKKII